LLVEDADLLSSSFPDAAAPAGSQATDAADLLFLIWDADCFKTSRPCELLDGATCALWNWFESQCALTLDGASRQAAHVLDDASYFTQRKE